MRHIVALSGGKDSVAMSLRLAEVEPRNYEYFYTPTGWELPEMEEHIVRLEDVLGHEITPIPGPTMDQVIEAQQALPNFRMRFCTRLIKIVPFEKFIRSIGECVIYVGIRADESGDREGVDYDRIHGVTRRFPMDEWGWNIQDVLSYLECKGITIPERTDCDACFFQTLYEWWLFWNRSPERWAKREAIEERFGYTFRSDRRDSWPAGMKGLRQRFESGDIPKDRRTKRSTMCAVCAR